VFHVNYFGGHYLPEWHPNADYREEYSARKDLGGGVIFTSIHGLDNIRWLFGEVEELSCFHDKVSKLEIDIEDYVAADLKLKNGLYVHFSTDFLSRSPQHRMFITGERGNIEFDFIENIMKVFSFDTGSWKDTTFEFDVNDMYLSEMKYFIECVAKHEKPKIDLSEGRKTLELALALKESSEKRKFIRMASNA
jgi:predicted dehydrogenase